MAAFERTMQLGADAIGLDAYLTAGQSGPHAPDESRPNQLWRNLLYKNQ
jgi:hypothetical protein